MWGGVISGSYSGIVRRGSGRQEYGRIGIVIKIILTIGRVGIGIKIIFTINSVGIVIKIILTIGKVGIVIKVILTTRARVVGVGG